VLAGLGVDPEYALQTPRLWAEKPDCSIRVGGLLGTYRGRRLVHMVDGEAGTAGLLTDMPLVFIEQSATIMRPSGLSHLEWEKTNGPVKERAEENNLQG
jgi:hypothetical protein